MFSFNTEGNLSDWNRNFHPIKYIVFILHVTFWECPFDLRYPYNKLIMLFSVFTFMPSKIEIKLLVNTERPESWRWKKMNTCTKKASPRIEFIQYFICDGVPLRGTKISMVFYKSMNSLLEELKHIKKSYLFWDKEYLDGKNYLKKINW